MESNSVNVIQSQNTVVVVEPTGNTITVVNNSDSGQITTQNSLENRFFRGNYNQNKCRQTDGVRAYESLFCKKDIGTTIHPEHLI